MRLTVRVEARKQIERLYQEGDRLLLDFEDGQGPFVDTGASCQLYLDFRLLLIPKGFPRKELRIYDTCLETELGEIWLKKASERFLDTQVELKMEPTYKRLQLIAKSGILAANVPLERIVWKQEEQVYGKISHPYRPSC